MANLKREVSSLAGKPRSELKRMLENELGTAYERQITDSLRNDFLRACYNRLAPGEDPAERARTHDRYDDSWRTKRVLATALRMLLADRGVREPDRPLTELDNQALAQLIVAIRMRDADVDAEQTASEDQPPERSPPGDERFTDRLPLEDVSETQIREWVEGRLDTADASHAVYVLDCTPPVGNEWNSLRAIRARAERKQNAGESLTKKEKAAAALTRGERAYYVGETGDVVDRVLRHLGGAAHGGGDFTHTFVPQALVDITWFGDAETAKRHEPQRPRELTVDGASFAYWE